MYINNLAFSINPSIFLYIDNTTAIIRELRILKGHWTLTEKSTFEILVWFAANDLKPDSKTNY